MKRALRLAVVYPSFGQAGGAENHSIAACSALARRGHSVTLYTSSYDEALFPAQATLPFDVVTVGGRGLYANPLELLRLMWRMPALLRDADLIVAINFPASAWVMRCGQPRIWLCLEPKRNLYPGVMYADAPGFGPHGYRGLRLSSLASDPHLLLPFGARAALQRLLDQRSARGMRAILTNSPYISEKCAQVYPALAGRIHTTWAPLDMPVPGPADIRRDPFILIPTRLEPIKGVDHALRAVKRLADDGGLAGWKVVIMGDGEARPALEDQARALGLGEYVAFTGYVSREKRAELYASCAFALYPALAEPLGLPVAEAALYRKATIAAHRGGPADMIVDGQTGQLVDVTDEHALTGALASWMRQPEQAAACGERAYAYLAPRMTELGWGDAFEAALFRYADEPRTRS